MGISITQYRQSIGLFNRVKFSTSYRSFRISIFQLTLVFLLFAILLMLLSGDIETHPGPPILKLRKLSVCHSNIRGLSESKLRAIKTCLCDRYDIITLSETFLSCSSSQDLTLPGFHPIVRRDRDSFGGGVCSLHQRKYNVQKISTV